MQLSKSSHSFNASLGCKNRDLQRHAALVKICEVLPMRYALRSKIHTRIIFPSVRKRHPSFLTAVRRCVSSNIQMPQIAKIQNMHVHRTFAEIRWSSNRIDCRCNQRLTHQTSMRWRRGANCLPHLPLSLAANRPQDSLRRATLQQLLIDDAEQVPACEHHGGSCSLPLQTCPCAKPANARERSKVRPIGWMSVCWSPLVSTVSSFFETWQQRI